MNKPRVKGKHDELTKEGTQGPAPSFQAEVPHQDEDSSQCKGVKINGSQCPRSSNEAGGNMVRGLCRRCLEKFEATAALAAAAAAAATAATASTGPAYGKQHADPPKAKVSKKKNAGKTMGLGQLLQSAAKPIKVCLSCDSSGYEDQMGACPKSGYLLCRDCLQVMTAAAEAAAYVPPPPTTKVAQIENNSKQEVTSDVSMAVDKEDTFQETRERVAWLIGKQGSNLRKLEKEAGGWCQLSILDGYTGSPFVRITAMSTAVLKAAEDLVRVDIDKGNFVATEKRSRLLDIATATGLDKGCGASFPTETPKDSGDGDEDDECPICLDDLRDTCVCKLPCGHRFHVLCVEELRDFKGSKTTCPLCRHECNADDVLEEIKEDDARKKVASRAAALEEARTARAAKQARQQELRAAAAAAAAEEEEQRREARAAAEKEARRISILNAEVMLARVQAKKQAQDRAEIAMPVEPTLAGKGGSKKGKKGTEKNRVQTAQEENYSGGAPAHAAAKETEQLAKEKMTSDAHLLKTEDKKAKVSLDEVLASQEPTATPFSITAAAGAHTIAAIVNAADLSDQLQAAGGSLFELFRRHGIADNALDVLSEHKLDSPSAILCAHDEALAALGIKKGSRMKILKIVSVATLVGEDDDVKSILENHHLGKYRQCCAEEMIDLEALSIFLTEPDEDIVELGVHPEDVPMFRLAAQEAASRC